MACSSSACSSLLHTRFAASLSFLLDFGAAFPPSPTVTAGAVSSTACLLSPLTTVVCCGCCDCCFGCLLRFSLPSKLPSASVVAASL
uniref:Putative secreted protein n=1 Tax=Anopheles darlingi TaxID=43151 RepID=A0A2M4DQ99_ANODA